MDISRGLRDNLSYKTVIEYPTLHVCIGQSSSTHRYVLYDHSVNNHGLHYGMWDLYYGMWGLYYGMWDLLWYVGLILVD